MLDISIVITALPKIHAGLGFSATGLSWVPNAYTLAFGGLLLLGARADDILGRRRMFTAGLAVFTAASLGVGLAPAWLLAARAVQGAGAAVLAPSCRADHPDGAAQDPYRLGREFGATDVVAERGDEGIDKVRELSGGYGTHAVLEAVGQKDAYETALGVVRPGGVISRVGVPQYDEGPHREPRQGVRPHGQP